MKHFIILVFLIGFGASRVQAAPPLIPDSTLSFRNELGLSISRGQAWLSNHQLTNGSWSAPDQPALTALAVMALLANGVNNAASPSKTIQSGLAFIRSCVRTDGGIHRGQLANYNTALCATALALAGNTADHPALRNARAALVRTQADFGKPGQSDTAFDGGVGYGSKYDHSDLNNTLAALEAIRATDFLERDRATGLNPPLNWAAAIAFLQNCQNLSSHNRADWVSNDPKDVGGFVYYPGHSMAGGVTNPVTGRVALRSYGSISYAGLLSYIHAQLQSDDPRVAAVLDWLRANYTLEENPGMGQQGLFYYLHLMAKALTAANLGKLELKDGKSVDWRMEVGRKLLDLQQTDGSWFNPVNRWMEKDPNLTTAYAVLTLSIISHSLTLP